MKSPPRSVASVHWLSTGHTKLNQSPTFHQRATLFCCSRWVSIVVLFARLSINLLHILGKLKIIITPLTELWKKKVCEKSRIPRMEKTGITKSNNFTIVSTWKIETEMLCWNGETATSSNKKKYFLFNLCYLQFLHENIVQFSKLRPSCVQIEENWAENINKSRDFGRLLVLQP